MKTLLHYDGCLRIALIVKDYGKSFYLKDSDFNQFGQPLCITDCFA